MDTWKVTCWIIGWVGKIVATLLFMTCRVQEFGKEIETDYFRRNKGKGLLITSWHRGLMHFIYYYRNQGVVVMASASRDGELANQVCKRFGCITVRGSNTKRGSKALKELQALVERGHMGGVVCDAPTGPPYISKIGMIILAKRTGLPILPVMWYAERCWRIKSWDRSIIPRPFSKIVYLFDKEFIYVPADASQEECETYRKLLDERLRCLMYQTDHFFRIPDVKDPREIAVPNPPPDHET